MAAGEDNWREVIEHQELLWVFIEHELRLHKGETYEWAGELPQQALTILHQHAIQGDITELQQSICQWIVYSRKHREVTLDYALLYQLLEELDRTWAEQEEVLSLDEEAVLAESFNVFANHCMELLLNHRELFPPSNTHAWHKLKFMLKCLTLMYAMSAFKSCCPFRNDLHVETTNTLKRGTLEWYVSVQSQFQYRNLKFRDPVKDLIDLIEILNADLQKAITHYHHLFESTVKVNYPVLVYKQVEKQLSDEIAKTFSCQIPRGFNPSSESTMMNHVDKCSRSGATCHNNNRILQELDTDIFELFLVLQEFIRFKEYLPFDEQATLTLTTCHKWFSNAISHWFEIAKSKVRSRVYNSLDLDKIQGGDPYRKYSTSAMDTAICFVQLKEFWTQLAWPDTAGCFPFVRTIYEAICSGAVLYSSMCHKRLYDYQVTYETNDGMLSEKVLMAVNNMEHVQQQLQTLPMDLEVEKVLQAVEQQEGHVTADQCRKELESLWQDSHDDIMGRINGILATITEQMKPAVKKFVFHLAWAPEKLDPEKGLTPLMEYLEKNLKTMYMSFLEANFNRVLENIWKLVLNEIATTSRANIGKERPFFFERLSSSLSILVDFFHADGKALSLHTIQNALYQGLEQELRLHKSDTPHLIELYYLQRLEDQTKLFHAPFGCLTVNAYYDEAGQSVCVEVVSARDLMPCDPNGLSDPFVILELVPKHMFPGSSQQKTKVHKKTLYPFFNEHFEFPAKTEVCRANAAALSLVVMDYDYMRKNDFEGEAYVALNSLPGIDDTCSLERAPTELVLMFPRDRSDILTTLAMRSWDKDALELVKQEKLKKS